MNKRIYKKWHTAKSNPNLRMRTLRAIMQKDLPDFDRGRFIQIVQTVAYNNPENTEMICDLIHHSITLPIVSPYQYFIHTINGIYGMFGTGASGCFGEIPDISSPEEAAKILEDFRFKRMELKTKMLYKGANYD